MIRINEDELVCEGDLSLYNDNPFTGIASEYFKDGSLASEVEYRNGFSNGRTRWWYSNGQLKSDFECVRGLKNGQAKVWFDDGLIKSIAEYRYGIEITYEENNGKGEVLITRKIEPDSYQFSLIEQHKKLCEEWLASKN